MIKINYILTNITVGALMGLFIINFLNIYTYLNIARVFTVMFGSVMLFISIYNHLSGRVRDRSGWVYRNASPFWYWVLFIIKSVVYMTLVFIPLL